VTWLGATSAPPRELFFNIRQESVVLGTEQRPMFADARRQF
jgi:hypothetical protein